MYQNITILILSILLGCSLTINFYCIKTNFRLYENLKYRIGYKVKQYLDNLLDKH